MRVKYCRDCVEPTSTFQSERFFIDSIIVRLIHSINLVYSFYQVVYTGMFNEWKGGFESDLTVIRVAKDQYYIVTGTAQVSESGNRIIHSNQKFDYVDRASEMLIGSTNTSDQTSSASLLTLLRLTEC